MDRSKRLKHRRTFRVGPFEHVHGVLHLVYIRAKSWRYTWLCWHTEKWHMEPSTLLNFNPIHLWERDNLILTTANNTKAVEIFIVMKRSKKIVYIRVGPFFIFSIFKVSVYSNIFASTCMNNKYKQFLIQWVC